MSKHRFDHTVDRRDEPKPDREPTRLRRFEVITGNGGRRRWSLAEKRAIVAESFAPDAVASEVARRHGLRPQQVFGWRTELRKLAQAAHIEAARASTDMTLTFVPAVATSTPATGIASMSEAVPARVAPFADAPPPSVAPTVGSIEISLGKTVVRVQGAADAALLTAVLKTLKVRA